MIIKNSNIRRNIFENRYVIGVIIFVIILILLLIQVMNNETKHQIKEGIKTTQNTISKDTSYSTPVIRGETISQNKQESNKKVIEQFIKYCNNNEIEKAYQLLTRRMPKTSIFL